jgi:predicted PolB exonuclease-like 3'-5' exonuclease
VNTLVFDIETVPDVELGRRIFDLGDLDDASVAEAMFAKQRQIRGSDFLPPPQQRIVAISVVLRSRDGLKISSLGDEAATERELVQRFFDGLDRYLPELVSWNGSGFDLPVLQYRALRHGIDAHRYWEVGDTDRDFRYNNYLSRFHWRHIDLMDVLSGYGASGRASLELAAQLVGLPGKLGIGGAQVWSSYQRGDIAAIRDYCEIDVLNTFLVFLRFQLIRGVLDANGYRAELQQVEATLAQSDRPHLKLFLETWRTTRHGD